VVLGTPRAANPLASSKNRGGGSIPPAPSTSSRIDEMIENQKNIVVGTAGHVDHGKTALVKTLTGIDTDRLKEEKERGMTIEPGFAYLRLPSGRVVSVVDVPGHERFIKNMLRGISGVDVALLVVAADDGVMPQTREHLDILKLLNIQYGLIVISKVDLVDEETLLMATEEVETLVQGSFLEGSAIIPFSSQTGQGKDKIIQTIDHLIDQVIEKNQGGIFRLPIDRVFTMMGYGTVVTGTIASGKIKKGDMVEIYPTEKMTVVRNVQIHNQWVNEAYAGQRVGLNLPNMKMEEIERGMVLSEPQALISTHLINAKFHYLKSNSAPIQNRMRIKFYSGTTEVIGRMILMGPEKLLPGEECFVQFRLEKKISPLPYDRYIVRTLSPMMTIGGGLILEIQPKKYSPFHYPSTDYLKMLENRNAYETIETLIKKESYQLLRIGELTIRLGINQEEVIKICDDLIKEKRVLRIGEGLLIHTDSIHQLEKEILEKLHEFHEKNPDLNDASREEIRSKISNRLDPKLFEEVLQKLQTEGKIEIKQGRVKLFGFTRTLSQKQKYIYDELDRVCKEYGFRPLPMNILNEIRGNYGEKEVEQVLKLMINEGRLVKLKNQRLIHSDSIEKIKKILKDHIEKKGKLALAEAIEVIGIGRTQAQPIFEYLDSIRFTIRVGDYRVLYKGIEKNEGREINSMASGPITNLFCSKDDTRFSSNLGGES